MGLKGLVRMAGFVGLLVFVSLAGLLGLLSWWYSQPGGSSGPVLAGGYSGSGGHDESAGLMGLLGLVGLLHWMVLVGLVGLLGQMPTLC